MEKQEKGKVIQLFRELRKRQVQDLNKFCKEYHVCDRCHNPTKDVVEGGTKCQECLDYMKKYAKNKRLTDSILDDKDQKDKAA